MVLIQKKIITIIIIMKWEKEVNKIVIECWIRSEPTKRKYRQRMKQIWDEIGVFDVTEQRLADQAKQIITNKWLIDVEIEEIERRCQERENNEGLQLGDEERNVDGLIGETEADRR